jgi:hypothetical protein
MDRNRLVAPAAALIAIHGPFTNPYFGEDKIGLLQWAPVIAAIAIGLWSAWEAFRSDATDPTATAIA